MKDAVHFVGICIGRALPFIKMLKGVAFMEHTDKEIIGVLLKRIFDKGLVSEATYRNAQNRLRTFDEPPLQQQEKECGANGHTKN